MGTNSESVKCKNCSSVLDEAASVPVEERKGCPHCGATARVFEAEIIENTAARDFLAMKARHGSSGRPFYEAKSGADLHRASGRWSQLDQVVDHENDRYFKRVVDIETGEIVRLCDEPLSEHQGYGSAKKTPSGNKS